MRTGTITKTFPRYGRSVLGVAFAPDGRILASRNQDGTVRLWDLKTNQLLRTLGSSAEFVDSMAFSPDGLTLATGYGNGTVRLWDVRTGVLKAALLSPGIGWAFALAFGQDGRTLAIGGFDRCIRLWSVEKGTWLKSFTDIADVISVALSPDGRILAGATRSRAFAGGARKGAVKVWGVRTGAVLKTLQSGSGPRVAFSPDGRLLASASCDGGVRLWDVNTWCMVQAMPQLSAYYALAFSPDGSTLATGCDDGTVKIWKVDPEPPMMRILGEIEKGSRH